MELALEDALPALESTQGIQVVVQVSKPNVHPDVHPSQSLRRSQLLEAYQPHWEQVDVHLQ